MPFKIRTKLLIAFFAVIVPFLLITGGVSLYNMNIIHKGSREVEAISDERPAVMGLQLALDRVLMPVNDYIITGDKKYRDDFLRGTEDVEMRIKEIEGILERLDAPEVKEEKELLRDVKEAWHNIREISLKIFAIQDPVGDSDAAMLMEEMDYKWAYPAIERLKRWQEIDMGESRKVREDYEIALKRVVAVIIAGGFILLFLGGLFAVFYSRMFVRPIETIHERAGAIAKGDFRTRLEIKTGDEIQQLSDAMNEMAAQLDSLYSNMQAMVEERTLELKESEERYRLVTETANDAIICIKGNGVVYLWNKKACELFGYSAEESIGKGLHKLIVPERYREKMQEGLKKFSQTGTVAFAGKPVELFALRKDGTEFPVELSKSATNIKGEWHAVGIVRDITERKNAEEKIKEQMDYLIRFEKATVEREFRMKELRDKVKELEEELRKKV